MRFLGRLGKPAQTSVWSIRLSQNAADFLEGTTGSGLSLLDAVASSGIRGARDRMVGALLAMRLKSLWRDRNIWCDDAESESSPELEGVRGGEVAEDDGALTVTWRTSETEMVASAAISRARAEDLGVVVKTT